MARSEKRLSKLAIKTSITKVNIQYGKEIIKFDLTDELTISESNINRELKEQPTHYGFLTMLQTKLLTYKEYMEAKADKIYASKYLKACETKNPKTGKPYADKTASQMAKANENYVEAVKAAIKAKEDYNIITSCVKSFEQRSEIIRTLSANVRKVN